MNVTRTAQEEIIMDSIEKLKEELNNNPELQEKINAEAKRIAENKEASDPREAIARRSRQSWIST